MPLLSLFLKHTYHYVFQEPSTVLNDCIIDHLHKDHCMQALGSIPKVNSSLLISNQWWFDPISRQHSAVQSQILATCFI